MSEKIESKAKTLREIYNIQDTLPNNTEIWEHWKSKWVPLKEAQKLENVIEGYEKALQKITAIANEDEEKIAEANKIIIEEKPATFSIHGDYEEDKIDYLNDKLKRINEVLKNEMS